jgi:hypothetical protein
MNQRPEQPVYTDCRNCGRADHRGYACPCVCHERKRVRTGGIRFAAVDAAPSCSRCRTDAGSPIYMLCSVAR